MPRKTLILLAVIHIILSLFISQVILPPLLQNEGMEVGYDEYDVLGWNLARGQGFRSDHGELSVVRGPSYPALLAVVYKLSGERNYQAVQVLQALLSACTLLLVHRIANRILGPRHAVAAALVYCFHPLVLWFSARIYLETWFTFFMTATIYAILMVARQVRWKRILALALLLTATLYIKTIALILLPILLIYLIIMNAGWLRAVSVVTVVILISILLIAPWTYRNYQVTSGKLVPVHASLALPLLGGHYLALSMTQSPLSSGQGIHDSFVAFPVVTVGQALERAEYPYRSLKEELLVDKAAVGFILDYYRENPWMLIQNSLIRYAQFWYLGHKPYFSVAMIFISLISLGLAVWSVSKNWRNRQLWLPLLVVVVYSGVHALIIGLARLQVMIIPMLALLMAPALVQLYEIWLEPRLQKHARTGGRQ